MHNHPAKHTQVRKQYFYNKKHIQYRGGDVCLCPSVHQPLSHCKLARATGKHERGAPKLHTHRTQQPQVQSREKIQSVHIKQARTIVSHKHTRTHKQTHVLSHHKPSPNMSAAPCPSDGWKLHRCQPGSLPYPSRPSSRHTSAQCFPPTCPLTQPNTKSKSTDWRGGVHNQEQHTESILSLHIAMI